MDVTANPIKDGPNAENSPDPTLSLFAHDRKSLVLMQRNQEVFGRSVSKQLKTAKIDEADYVPDLLKTCDEVAEPRIDALTRSLFKQLIPGMGPCLSRVYLTSSAIHTASKLKITLTGPDGTATLLPLVSVKTLHIVICSKDNFPFVDELSRATPNVSTLIVEHAYDPCSDCVPHQVDQFWNAVQWNPNQLKRLAFVRFAPNGYKLAGNLLDDRLFDCHNLIALDLRLAGLPSIGDYPLAVNFPSLKELRLDFNDYDDDTFDSSRVFSEVTACQNLEFLDVRSNMFCVPHLNTPRLISQLQPLNRLTHLHIYLGRCDLGSFAAFFRNPDIQLQKVSIKTDDDAHPLIQDVIEGNPGLQVLVVCASLYKLDVCDMNLCFAGLGGLADLKAFIYYVDVEDEESVLPSFLSLLDPAVHTELQVAAVLYRDCSPDGCTGIVDQVQQRFEGHRVNNRRVEILGLGAYGNDRIGAVCKRIAKDYPDSACCIEPCVLHDEEDLDPDGDFRFHFSSDWKSAV